MTGAVALMELNRDGVLARRVLGACLDIPRWIEAMDAGRPYADLPALRAAGEQAAAGITWPEVAGALDRHPRIGERPAAGGHSTGEGTGAETESAWSSAEQSGVGEGDVQDLAAGNAAYEARFGHIFLICATGLSGAELLAALRTRLGHDLDTEKPVIIGELRKIAALRLAKAVTG